MANKRQNKVDQIQKKNSKDCTVKLKRLSSATVSRYLNPKINHSVEEINALNLNVRIRDNILEIENQGSIIGTKETFNMQIKISSTEATVSNSVMPRNLRNKTSRNLVCAEPKPKKASTELIVRRDNHSINSEWNKCKGKDIVDSDDFIMAKVKGYVPWPGKAIEIIKKNTVTQVKVEFFGAEPHEMYGIVNMKEICLFKNAGIVIRLISKNNCPKFKKAVREAEIVCGIPQSQSLLC